MSFIEGNIKDGLSNLMKHHFDPQNFTITTVGTIYSVVKVIKALYSNKLKSLVRSINRQYVPGLDCIGVYKWTLQCCIAIHAAWQFKWFDLSEINQS